MLDADETTFDACRQLRDQDEHDFHALLPPRHRPVMKGRAEAAVLHQVGEPEPPPSTL